MTKDLNKLLEKAAESLQAAELLLDKDFNSFAASRAYYAMFYVAEALLASIGKSYSSHGTVTAVYGKEFAKTGKLDPKFHRWLIDSQDLRNVGDYGLDDHVSSRKAREVCKWASEFIRTAEVYLEV